MSLSGLRVSNHLQLVEKGREIFAYNSIFGNLKKLDTEEIKLINLFRSYNEPGFQIENLPEHMQEKVAHLHQRLFIVPCGFDEYSLIIDKLGDYKDRITSGRQVRKLQLTVTDSCNLACKYCYTGKVRKLYPRMMPFSIAKTAIDQFIDLVKANGRKKVYIRFFGGEPLLNWPLIEQSLKYVETLDTNGIHIQYCINTNGTLITDEIARTLANYDFDLDISLDAPKPFNDQVRFYKSGEGSYNHVLRGLGLLISNGFNKQNIEISATLTHFNINHLLELVDIAAENGVSDLTINTTLYDEKFDIIPTDKKVDKLVEARIYGKSKGVHVNGKWLKLFNRLKDSVINYCGRLGEQFSVDPIGNVYACSGLKLKFGTVKDLKSILSSSAYILL